MTAAWIATAVCGVAVAGLLVAEAAAHAVARALLKTLASLAFVALALALDATASVYGRWVLAALVLGLVGDVCLLSARSAAFLAGLAAFLVSHGLYAVAFGTAGPHGGAVALGAAIALAAGAGILRWLWPHLGAAYRGPVLAYVVAILAMCTLAGGHAAASGRWAVLAGALLFAASDIAVARDRFVQAGGRHKIWGLPTYYLAQLLLAGSVRAAA